jgi:Tol biopolymer transport system component
MQNKRCFWFISVFSLALVWLTSCISKGQPNLGQSPLKSNATSEVTTSLSTVLPTNSTPHLSASRINGWAVYSNQVSQEPLVTQIFLKNLETGDIKQLTTSGNNDHPLWSPDGTQIVFLSWTEENSFDLYIMDKNGDNKRPVVVGPAKDMMADWSPDGKKIVFASDMDGHLNIFVVNLDDLSKVKLTNNSVTTGSPKWSPDGKQIAFISNEGVSGRSQVFIMNADGSDVKQLTNYDPDHFEDSPIWCPNMSCIIFTRLMAGVPKLMIIDLTSKTVTPYLNSIFDPDNNEASLARSSLRGYITFSVDRVFYAVDMKSDEIYALNIQARDLSLYP